MVKGMAIIAISRDPAPDEVAFLRAQYDRLSDEQMKELIDRLTRIQMSEMAPYYVMRYGFYEGHTPWRADPIAIAWIFGLRSLKEIESVFEGNLHNVLIQHFTRVGTVHN